MCSLFCSRNNCNETSRIPKLRVLPFSFGSVGLSQCDLPLKGSLTVILIRSGQILLSHVFLFITCAGQEVSYSLGTQERPNTYSLLVFLCRLLYSSCKRRICRTGMFLEVIDLISNSSSVICTSFLKLPESLEITE